MTPLNEAILKASLTSVGLDARDEALSAAKKHAPMSSAHEGYAVMLEEVDELWEHVKTNPKRRDMSAMRQEAVQVAAMAIRFVVDICDAGVKK